jgi:TatA/E family protein of Tat protein translocase
MVSLPIAALDNPVDLLLLLVVALLIFGKDLPQVARTLGKGIRDLKESVNLSEMGDAINSIHEVRNAVSPGALMRAAIPGVAEFQESADAARDALDPQTAAARVAYPLPSPELSAEVAPPPPPGSSVTAAPPAEQAASLLPEASATPEPTAPPAVNAPGSPETQPTLAETQSPEPPADT